jgi:hypothetical protein
VEVAANFPEACRYVLETLGTVYKYDAEARERKFLPQERLQFHQQHSAPVMEKLQQWMEAQFAQHLVEPNSGLGKAITYFLRHWKGLTASPTIHPHVKQRKYQEVPYVLSTTWLVSGRSITELLSGRDFALVISPVLFLRGSV